MVGALRHLDQGSSAWHNGRDLRQQALDAITFIRLNLTTSTDTATCTCVALPTRAKPHRFTPIVTGVKGLYQAVPLATGRALGMTFFLGEGDCYGRGANVGFENGWGILSIKNSSSRHLNFLSMMR